MLTMNTKTANNLALILLSIISVIYSGCDQARPGKGERKLISFKNFNGIDYSEVARRQNNGLSFNEYGYQLEPQWKMKFVTDDSVSIFSPTKKMFINFPLTRGYDSVFNAARSWFKVKLLSKDSIILEILKAEGDSIDIRGSKVYMLFYANNYVKNVLHTDTSILRRPSRKDTLYIKSLSKKANADLSKAFSARQPVKFISKSKQVKAVQSFTAPDEFNKFDSSDDYLDPNFDITINSAYKNFYYSFAVTIDDKGQMHYLRPLIGFDDEDFKKSYLRLSEEIMNTYLKLYLDVKPGTTLGIPHSSVISLHVRGLTAKAK